jgi:hypothetical protein
MILLSLKQKYYQKITIDPSGLMMWQDNNVYELVTHY